MASGYPVYTPGAGPRNLQFGATANHFFAGRWIAVGGLGIGRLLGDAADSPIVRERTHVTGFAAIGYQLF
jgi:outer membrane scaffolding protein for murein synthesis (MipA/OmpV family)